MTDRESSCLISDPASDSQVLYFTTRSIDPGSHDLWYLAEHDGTPNLMLLDARSGRTRMLTTNTQGRAWQYQGFEGCRGVGLHVWSTAVDVDRGIAYVIQDDRILAIPSHGSPRVLAVLPTGRTTAFIAVSHCGRYLCVPTTDERALIAPGAIVIPANGTTEIARRCRTLGFDSRIAVLDAVDGRTIAESVVPGCWITHVQFHPTDPKCVLYNHEWSESPGTHRMWLWDASGHRMLRLPPAAADDWICHEFWDSSGDAVLYHGGRKGGPACIGRIEPRTGNRSEIDLPMGWQRYGHFQAHPRDADMLVCDGYYETADDLGDRGRWITLVRVDWKRHRLTWTPLCQHHSAWSTQDSHPHPFFGPDGCHVYFTGGCANGRRAVYRIAVPDHMQPHP